MGYPPLVSKPPLPVIKAFLVCDKVIQDAQSGKKSLIGLFHEIKGSTFPTVHPELWIYANLTDARGHYVFEIRFVNLTDDGRIVGNSQPSPITIPGPLQTTELSAQLRHVALPGPGTYEFQLIANGELAATKDIRVGRVPSPAPPAPPAPPGTEAIGDEAPEELEDED